MIGRISDETRKQVKCRRGIQKQSEHSKWNGVYQILFPGEAVPDRPCKYSELSVDKYACANACLDADFGPPDTQRSLEELVRFRQQSGRMIKEKLRQILLPDEMTELILQSVEEVFDSLRPDSTARTVAHNTVHGEDEPAPHLDRPQDQPTVFSGTQFTDTPAYGDPQDQILLMGGESIEDSPAWLEEYNGSFQQSLFESDLGNNGAFGLWHNEPEYGGSN